MLNGAVQSHCLGEGAEEGSITADWGRAGRKGAPRWGAGITEDRELVNSPSSNGI